MFKKLTGRKFEIKCLSSVVLSRGFTQATFQLLGKMLYLKKLFIAFDNGVLKDSAPIFIKAGRISSGPIAFLGFNFWRDCLTLSLSHNFVNVFYTYLVIEVIKVIILEFFA